MEEEVEDDRCSGVVGVIVQSAEGLRVRVDIAESVTCLISISSAVYYDQGIE